MTHPFSWPEVTRGAERELREASGALAARGHRVDVVTGTAHGLARVSVEDGVRIRRVRLGPPRPERAFAARPEARFGLVAAAAAAGSRADVVTSYLYADAYGALVGSRGGHRRRPVVLKLTGTLPRDRLRAHRLEHDVVRRALHGVDAVWVNSRYAQEVMADWDRPMDVVPAGVRTDVFRPGAAARSPRPLVLCTSAPDDPRKRVIDLIDAWPAVLASVPDSVLRIVQKTSAAARSRLLARLPAAARRSVEFAGPLDDAALAAAYAHAWVTVAPAVHEALGLTTLESLACGTPVVGADSGATRELLADVGVLYPAADPVALAEAIASVLGGAPEPADGARYRAAVASYAWANVIDNYEARYRVLTGLRS
jgi:glycosyltransferase involved in cell wall biosynthesis